MSRRAPLLVDLLVAASALLGGHEEVGRYHPAHVGLGRRGEEGPFGPLALPLHRGGGKQRVDDAVLGRGDLREPASSGGEENQDRGADRPGPGAPGCGQPGRPPEPGEGQRRPEGHRSDVSVEKRAEGTRGAGEEEGHPEKHAQPDGQHGPACQARQIAPVPAQADAERPRQGQAEDPMETHVGEVDDPGVRAGTEVEAVQAEGDQRDRQDRVTSCHAESPGMALDSGHSDGFGGLVSTIRFKSFDRNAYGRSHDYLAISQYLARLSRSLPVLAMDSALPDPRPTPPRCRRDPSPLVRPCRVPGEGFTSGGGRLPGRPPASPPRAAS